MSLADLSESRRARSEARPIDRIRQVQIRNYKSIGKAVVNLGDLTMFVGANGVGKSNFLDALAFVSQCLTDSIELAFKNRGGLSAVRRRSGGHPTHIGLRLIVDLGPHQVADYSFEIAAEKPERFVVAHERCHVSNVLGTSHTFEVEQGRFKTPIEGIRPNVAADRLALFAASATRSFVRSTTSSRECGSTRSSRASCASHSHRTPATFFVPMAATRPRSSSASGTRHPLRADLRASRRRGRGHRIRRP